MQKFIYQRSSKQVLGSASVPILWLRPLLKKGPAALYTCLLFLLILLTAVFLSSLRSTLYSGDNKIPVSTIGNQTVADVSDKHGEISKDRKNENPRKRSEKSGTSTPPPQFNCAFGNQTCSTLHYPTTFDLEMEEKEVCPEYFRWIHEDLRRWKETGITREMVEKGKKTANFRLVVMKGRAYVETYKKSIQTRDLFTIWGFVQLLRRYPARVPDLELMFDCDDLPVIRTRHYSGGPNKTMGPPPLFRYCGDRWTEDIVFPDWSFWGWAEINIRPWEQVLKEIKKSNKMIKWEDREPYAYWKGNPFVAETRRDLLKCNASQSQDWNARLFVQDWIQESQQGFNHSNLATQCTHRFKIYIEGYAWSVSEKYILACDSVTLLVKPRFYDFFIRSLQPLEHYWPIRDNDKCKSIKYAVEWGTNNKQKAQEIGKAASNFIQQEVKMDNVYDYMFHLLNEYAKLLKFEVRVPEGAVEVCSETMACSRSGLEKEFMTQSMVTEPSTKAPCSLPPPFHPTSLRLFYANKLNLINRVARWEDSYWNSRTGQLIHPRISTISTN